MQKRIFLWQKSLKILPNNIHQNKTNRLVEVCTICKEKQSKWPLWPSIFTNVLFFNYDRYYLFDQNKQNTITTEHKQEDEQRSESKKKKKTTHLIEGALFVLEIIPTEAAL